MQGKMHTRLALLAARLCLNVGRKSSCDGGFKALLQSQNLNSKGPPQPRKLIKKLDDIPLMIIDSSDPRRTAILLSKKALIGKFTGLWPTPKAIDLWVAQHWTPKLQSQLSFISVGRGFSIFLFDSQEDQGLLFRSGPYFMGSRGMHLPPILLISIQSKKLKLSQFG